jgi:hypothetical protein
MQETAGVGPVREGEIEPALPISPREIILRMPCPGIPLPEILLLVHFVRLSE